MTVIEMRHDMRLLALTPAFPLPSPPSNPRTDDFFPVGYPQFWTSTAFAGVCVGVTPTRLT